MLSQADHQRFWRSVVQADGKECWPWKGTVARNGYGRFHVGKRRLTASRLVLEMKLGRDLSADERACHKCDNRICCNPAHIFLGSQADNMRDCVNKGRMHRHGGKRRGEGNPRALLSAQQVDEIRGLRGTLTQPEIAKIYGVSRQTVSAIQTGSRWMSGGGAGTAIAQTPPSST